MFNRLNSSRRFCLTAESLLIVEADAVVVPESPPASSEGATVGSAIAS